MSIDPAPTSGPEASRSPSRRWLKWALTASLAINALFIGGFVGAIWRHGGPLSAQNNSVPGNLLSYAETLPRLRAGAPFTQVKEFRRSLQPLRKSLQEARREIIAAVAADPFDRARFIEAQKRLADIEAQFRAQQSSLLADVAGSLNADERRGYAKWWEHRRTRLGRGRGGADDDADTQPRK